MICAPVVRLGCDKTGTRRVFGCETVQLLAAVRLIGTSYDALPSVWYSERSVPRVTPCVFLVLLSGDLTRVYVLLPLPLQAQCDCRCTFSRLQPSFLKVTGCVGETVEEGHMFPLLQRDGSILNVC